MRYALCTPRLLDVAAGRLRADLAVLVEDERILDVLPQAALPEEVETLRLEDCTLLPGLIDVHVHLDGWELPWFLVHGVTTVRDVGNNPDWIFAARERAQRPEEPAPYILCCGPFLDGMPYYHENLSWGLRTTQDARDAVHCLKARGADQVKLYSDLTPELAAACAREASKAGLPSLGDFYTLPDIPEPQVLRAAVGAGMGELEHLSGLPPVFSRSSADFLLEHDVCTVATRAIFEGVLQEEYRQRARAFAKWLPTHLAAYWERTFQEVDQAQEALCDTARQYLSYLIQNGGRFGIGTDVPCWGAFPGALLAEELRIHEECGMTRAQALEAVTLGNARLLGIDRETGTLEPGKRADLIAVNGDPMADLKALTQVALTVKGGTCYTPESLRSRLPEHPASDTLRAFGQRTLHCTDWRQENRRILATLSREESLCDI